MTTDQSLSLFEDMANAVLQSQFSGRLGFSIEDAPGERLVEQSKR
jgi:hypothetical protein